MASKTDHADHFERELTIIDGNGLEELRDHAVEIGIEHHMLKCFFFNDTATTEIYTLSLHDALPICDEQTMFEGLESGDKDPRKSLHVEDRKSTRLNSSHSQLSYAVFCLKKKTAGLDGRDQTGDDRRRLAAPVRAGRAAAGHPRPALFFF